MNTFSVIRVYHIPTNESYIAYTSKDPEVAFYNLQAHALQDSDSNRTIHRAMRNYGCRAFDMEVLHKNIYDESQAKLIRDGCITRYNPLYNKNLSKQDLPDKDCKIPWYIEGFSKYY